MLFLRRQVNSKIILFNLKACLKEGHCVSLNYTLPEPDNLLSKNLLKGGFKNNKKK